MSDLDRLIEAGYRLGLACAVEYLGHRMQDKGEDFAKLMHWMDDIRAIPLDFNRLNAKAES